MKNVRTWSRVSSAVLLAFAVCAPVAAKSVSRIPIACSSPDVTGYAILMRQGSSYTFGIGGDGAGAVGNWHFRFVVDGGAQVLVDTTILSPGPGFNLTTFATVDKGHLVTLTATNLSNNISCQFQVSTSRV